MCTCETSLHKRICLSLIVVRLLLLFYGLKKLLWPPRVFMEGDWGGGQQGEINGDPWWGRLKRRRGGGTRGHGGKVALVQVMENKQISPYFSVCLLSSLFAQANSLCFWLHNLHRMWSSPHRKAPQCAGGLFGHTWFPSWGRINKISHRSSPIMPPVPELSVWLLSDQSYVRGLRKCRASCSTFWKQKNKTKKTDILLLKWQRVGNYQAGGENKSDAHLTDSGTFSLQCSSSVTEASLCFLGLVRWALISPEAASAVFLRDSCLCRETQLRKRLSAHATFSPNGLNLEPRSPQPQAYFSLWRWTEWGCHTRLGFIECWICISDIMTDCNIFL